MQTSFFKAEKIVNNSKRAFMKQKPQVHKINCSDKKVFFSISDANRYAFQNGLKQHGYHCPSCGKVHLTKMH